MLAVIRAKTVPIVYQNYLVFSAFTSVHSRPRLSRYRAVISADLWPTRARASAGPCSSEYTYTPELYGTGARATGSGFASAIGRIGSPIGPYVVGVVLPAFGQGGTFTLGALSFAAAALAVGALGIETKGVALEALAAGDDARGRLTTADNLS